MSGITLKELSNCVEVVVLIDGVYVELNVNRHELKCLSCATYFISTINRYVLKTKN